MAALQYSRLIGYIATSEASRSSCESLHERRDARYDHDIVHNQARVHDFGLLTLPRYDGGSVCYTFSSMHVVAEGTW